MQRKIFTKISLCSFLFASILACAEEKNKYLEDYKYLKNTVRLRSASVKAKNIPWPEICEKFKPLFEKCDSDEEHVKLLMRMLAKTRDGHTGLMKFNVPRDDLPSKWNVVGGGGIWAVWADGLYIVQGVKNNEHGKKIPLGSVVAKIKNKPAWIDIETLKQYCYKWQGYSTDHSFFGTISNAPFFFDYENNLDVTFISPELKEIKVNLKRYTESNFNRFNATVPIGVKWQRGAVSKMLSVSWTDKLGYIRITGCMNKNTLDVYNKEFDKLKGAKAIILDCRSMGGGGDSAAWAMAGRFFTKPVSNGMNGTIKPTGSWQFDGPVVMLQNETEVSSAETFTWAMSETKRVVSVGRPTGGWCIIPQMFKCPSGITFRMGVYNRPTPITRKLCEGKGWVPDIEIPYGPLICAQKGFVRQIGTDALQLLESGVSRDNVIALFLLLFVGKTDFFLKSAALLKDKIKGWSPEKLAGLVKDDMKTRLAMENALLSKKNFFPPDIKASEKRFNKLKFKALNMGLTAELAQLETSLKKIKDDPKTQKEYSAVCREITKNVSEMNE